MNNIQPCSVGLNVSHKDSLSPMRSWTGPAVFSFIEFVQLTGASCIVLHCRSVLKTNFVNTCDHVS